MKRGGPLRSDPEKTRAWRERGAAAYADKVRSQALGAGESVQPSQPPRSSRSPVRPSPRKRRNDGPWRAEVMAEYGEVCVSCGDTAHVQADHVWPRSQGGPSVVENGLPLCGEFSRNTPGGCHPAKTAGTMLIRPEWLTERQIAWLAEVGWVIWDGDGRPIGRGWKHFADRIGRSGSREGG